MTKLEAADREKLLALQKERDEFYNGLPKVLVSKVAEQKRVVRILPRGNWMDESGEVVHAALPHFLPQPKIEGREPNRLDLANWLVSRENPLTARTEMNRRWQQFFGLGISRVLEDLGAQGEPPVNPQLLDWLACEFMDSGWDVKHMVRLLATSDAYQQSAAATPELITRDPDNQLLAHGARFRMPAEMIRDLALSTSGLLDSRIGGPSVKPYQPGDLWGELAHQKHNYHFSAQLFVQDHGADLYRRTMYTFWKRSVPPPNLNALDAPSREVCTVRRERTNTPLQALVLLNDPTFVEAARKIAERVTLECNSDPAACIERVFELVVARKPSAHESEILAGEYQRQLESFKDEPKAAESLLAVGESPRNEKLDAVQQAALTNVSLVILNLDEAVCR
jgi:hypothetical protein